MKKNFTASVIIVLSAGLLSTLFCAGSAHAIPAFTRANNVECSTCHTIFPELNEYGEAFLKNGYVYFGKDKKKAAEKTKASPVTAEAKPAAVPASDSSVKGDGNADLLAKLKAGMMISADAPATTAVPVQKAEAENSPVASGGEAKSEGIALSGIPELLPISFTANLHGTYNRNAVNELDFSTQSLKLNAGGNFKEKVGFFVTYFLYTEQPPADTANTSTLPTNTKSDIGELFVIWRHALETPVNIKVGRFQPKLGLWKTNNGLSTANSYATYAYTVGSSLFKAEQPQDAVEANMIFANRLFMAGGVVNRKNQNTKEWYVHTSVKIGGADYLANEPEIDLNKEESIFDYLTLTVGSYGYVGTNGNSPLLTPGISPQQNNYYRAGVDVDLLYKLFRLKLSGVMGKDDNPALTSLQPPLKSYVGAIEGEYTILQNLIGSLRFEYQDDGASIVRRFIPTVAYAPIENLKVAAEYKYEYGITYNTTGTTDIANQIGTLGVTFSF
jgi:hypothetical protein